MSKRRSALIAVCCAALAGGTLAGCTAEGVESDGEQTTTSEDHEFLSDESGDSAPVATDSARSDSEGISDEELTRAVESNNPSRPKRFSDTLDPFWQSLNLPGDPPVVDPVRTVALEEADDAHFDCMAEQGFPSVADSLGQRAIEFSREQEEAMKFAQYVCYASFPLEDMYFEPYSVEQLRAIYDWNVHEVTDCLREQGVEASVPPSFEAFAERYKLTGREHWTATEGIDLMTLEEMCPETPPDDLLYGGEG